MAETLRPDAVVIGAGVGGYPCAIKLAQLGKKTLLVERDRIGGTCLNWGCIPSKAIIQAADFYERTKKAAGEMGIEGTAQSRLDMRKLQAWKNKVVERLTGGIAQLLKGNKVEILEGRARFLGKGTALEVDGQRIEPRAVVIATGARPVEIPGIPIDERRVLSAKGALDLAEVPATLVVVGGGAIGLELGTAYAKLGSKVTVVEMLDTVLFGVEPELVRWVVRKLNALGVEILTGAKVTGLDKNGVRVGERTIEAEKILVSIGFKPNSEGLGLEDLGVARDGRGHIAVNERMETNVPGIYAIGDVTGAPYLAHRATKMGIVAAEAIAGKKTAFDARAVPAGIFTDPEIGTVGLTEEQARKKGLSVKVGKFPFSALGKAQIHDYPAPGVVKIVADAGSGLVLGVHICGHGANDLLGEAALGIEMGATLEDVALTIHAHPTLPEAIMEAAEAAIGKPIHAL
jgi:dihydrolipoamide dehydrogenase